MILEGLEIYTKWKAGKNTLIVWATHGDEKIGLHVIEYIKKKIKTQDYEWTFYFLIGNPLALKNNTRYIDEDLNRAFDSQQKSYEQQRAEAIKHYFKNIPIDRVYDIHSTATESKPMTLCTNNPLAIKTAKLFPIEHIVLGLVDRVPATTLTKYFSQQGAIDVAFECGSHANLENNPLIPWISDTIRNIHHDKQTLPPQKQTIIQIEKMITTQDPWFQYLGHYEGFELLTKGKVWWKDNNTEYQEYQEDQDSIIVIPNTLAIIQKEIKKNGTSLVTFIGKEIED